MVPRQPSTALLVPQTAREMPPRIPAPAYRHASPSGPWPWQDLDYEPESPLYPCPQSLSCPHGEGECGKGKHSCWAKYPQSIFPNWTPDQIRQSRILEVCAKSTVCVIYHMDVGNDGHFSNAEKHSITEGNKERLWISMHKERPPTRVRALFFENLSLPVMQMLGTKYKIEPFYFSSSVNGIPSRYQEEVSREKGDHITITLTFLRAIKVPLISFEPRSRAKTVVCNGVDQVNAQLALLLRNDDPNRRYDQTLLLDLLAIHMIRTPDSSTIISYHPSHDPRLTSAERLHSRVRLAGESVYWQNIFQESNDPTFVLLTILWYALYAWDESLAMLWDHIGRLEISVISTNDILFTKELHNIRAYLLYYASLLEDFRKSVEFIKETPHPVLAAQDGLEGQFPGSLLKRECRNLLLEIERLAMSREMQDKRLKNVMDLTFSSNNIDDSKQMRELTEATLRDSAAMKQISYLTMVFLPASFAAAIFGMNIQEINPGSMGSVAGYLETAIPLTAITIWVIVAFQGKLHVHESEEESSLLNRLWWPVPHAKRFIEICTGRKIGG